MKITLPIDSVLDDIYADSALGAVMGLRDAALPVPLLTPDHRPALLRLAVQGAACACSLGELSPYITTVSIPSADDAAPVLSLELSCQGARTPAEEAIVFHLRAAVSAATLHLVALATADTVRADRFSSLARHCADTIAKLLTDSRPFEARMRWA